MQFEGKVAVVYAGACGIGRAYCEVLLQKGCKVYFGDILEMEGCDTQQQFSTKYRNSKLVFKKCDVLVDAEVKDLMQNVIKEEGQVDIVIANAGIMDEKHWKKCLDLNLGGVMSVFYAAVEYMSIKHGGKGGHFVATSSVAGLKPFCDVPVYTATKHGIVAFIRAWGTAGNLAVTGIRCNSLCPHGIDTKMSRGVNEETFFLEEQGQHFLPWTANYRAKGFYFPTEVAGQALIKLLEDQGANGKCLEISEHGTYYTSFTEEVV